VFPSGAARTRDGQKGEAPHQFVLVEDQAVVVRDHAEAVPPLFVLLDVLEEVARVDDVVLQRDLRGEDTWWVAWGGKRGGQLGTLPSHSHGMARGAQQGPFVVVWVGFSALGLC